MKITPLQAVEIWNEINTLININERVPAGFSFAANRNAMILEPEIRIWNETPISDRKLIADTEIDLPLMEFPALPEFVTGNTYNRLKPLLGKGIDYPEAEESVNAIKKLLEDKKNEKPEKKKEKK